MANVLPGASNGSFQPMSPRAEQRVRDLSRNPSNNALNQRHHPLYNSPLPSGPQNHPPSIHSSRGASRPREFTYDEANRESVYGFSPVLDTDPYAFMSNPPAQPTQQLRSPPMSPSRPEYHTEIASQQVRQQFPGSPQQQRLVHQPNSPLSQRQQQHQFYPQLPTQSHQQIASQHRPHHRPPPPTYDAPRPPFQSRSPYLEQNGRPDLSNIDFPDIIENQFSGDTDPVLDMLLADLRAEDAARLDFFSNTPRESQIFRDGIITFYDPTQDTGDFFASLDSQYAGNEHTTATTQSEYSFLNRTPTSNLSSNQRTFGQSQPQLSRTNSQPVMRNLTRSATTGSSNAIPSSIPLVSSSTVSGFDATQRRMTIGHDVPPMQDYAQQDFPDRNSPRASESGFQTNYTYPLPHESSKPLPLPEYLRPVPRPPNLANLPPMGQETYSFAECQVFKGHLEWHLRIAAKSCLILRDYLFELHDEHFDLVMRRILTATKEIKQISQLLSTIDTGQPLFSVHQRQLKSTSELLFDLGSDLNLAAVQYTSEYPQDFQNRLQAFVVGLKEVTRNAKPLDFSDLY